MKMEIRIVAYTLWGWCWNVDHCCLHVWM